MIRSFACRETERLFNDEPSRRLPLQIQRAARRKLLLRQARRWMTCACLRQHLEALKGDRQGQHSIRISDQRRIRFRWEDQDAFDVEIVDYH